MLLLTLEGMWTSREKTRWFFSFNKALKHMLLFEYVQVQNYVRTPYIYSKFNMTKLWHQQNPNWQHFFMTDEQFQLI